MSGLFRSWSGKLPPTGKDPELLRLEKLAEAARDKLNRVQEHGRLLRAHRLESLDALETRRMTLHEILKRMEKEIADKNVDDYADVLAEVFGERVIYAHRAIGLEALLCQFMHQMLAKQHQLKILKRAAKDLQKLFQNQKSQNREEFHSFEALAVHVETMRLSLEAQYDDIFAAQHSLLARLHHVDAGGTMTNYKVVKPKDDGKEKKKPTLKVSAKHASNSPSSKSMGGGESDDDDEEMVNDVLTSKYYQDGNLSPSAKTNTAQPTSNGNSSTKAPSIPSAQLKKAATTSGTLKEQQNGSIYLNSISADNQPSARNRRREIEQRRLASGRGSGRGDGIMISPDMEKAREKMRALEASRVNKDASDSSSATFNMAQLRAKFERKGSSNSDDDTFSENEQKTTQERHRNDAITARRETGRSEGTPSRTAATAR